MPCTRGPLSCKDWEAVLLLEFVMALEETERNPKSFPGLEYVEDDIGCHFHFTCICMTQTEIKRKNDCGLALWAKGKILITLVLVLSHSMISPNKFNGIVNGLKNYIKEHEGVSRMWIQNEKSYCSNSKIKYIITENKIKKIKILHN